MKKNLQISDFKNLLEAGCLEDNNLDYTFRVLKRYKLTDLDRNDILYIINFILGEDLPDHLVLLNENGDIHKRY